MNMRNEPTYSTGNMPAFRNPNAYNPSARYEKSNGDLHILPLIFGGCFFYTIALFVFYIPMLVLGFPNEAATWLARLAASFFTVWILIDNLRGRMHWALLVIPAVFYLIIKFTLVFSE